MEKLADEIADFPEGVDELVHRRWIVKAVGAGSKQAVLWMLERGVDLNFRDQGGYSPVHVALEREQPDRCEVLEALVEAGAPVNLKGINDWTHGSGPR